jgi:hypothetical protein
MPTPFPGMDPYLERRGLWEQVHTGLIVEIQRFLTPLLRPHYHVAIEQRTYLALLPPDEQRVGKPDILLVSPAGGAPEAIAVVPSPTTGPVVAELPMPEEVLERYLEIRDAVTREVITVIEILSPTNKIPGEGRTQYERKRLKVLGSLTNLVEIDLLRVGEPFSMKVSGESDYRIVVSRSQHRPRADVYLFGVRDPIPDFPIPLRPDESEPILLLSQILHNLYDQGGYDLAIDYQQLPEPPLPDKDARWAAQVLARLPTSPKS